LAFLISLGIAVDDIPLSEDASGDEDMHLMTRFFQGDKGAFNTVFLSYSPILEKYLKMRYGRIAPREIIHDAVCDAFVKAVVKRETLMEINPKIFKEYLLKMGQNIIIDHIRKEKRKKESEMSLEGNIWGEPGDQILDEEPILLKDLVAFEGESPEETTSKFERTELVQKALGKLTSCERFIIEENVLGLSTNNEVAAKLKISIFKFQAIKRNAIQKLSKYLRDTWMR
jgi:RNA polymerase sigma factor (sigma-70 family)